MLRIADSECGREGREIVTTELLRALRSGEANL